MAFLLIGIALGVVIGALVATVLEVERQRDRDAEYRSMRLFVVARGYAERNDR